MIHLNYRDARPIYSQIVEGFRDQISAGILAPGEKLPSVRDLAAELAINPNTIQRSYRQLESEGWIVSVQGKGCFVASRSDVPNLEKARLLEEFHSAAQALQRVGFTRQALIELLQKEA